MLTAGLVLLLFVGYELWGTGRVTAEAQGRLREQLAATWQNPPAAGPPAPVVVPPAGPAPQQQPVAGAGVAVIRVPRFGPEWSRVVVEGVTPQALRTGPGHYPGTAEFGEVGNAVVSGHRTTYGAPFGRLDELRAGDPVVIETRDQSLRYQVTGSRVVEPGAVEVTLPVPGQRGATPTERLLTLTTCHPEFSARQRLVVSARLTGSQGRG
jgi:sortase A